MKTKTVRINVTGRVTGVCFRMSACSHGRMFPGLRGTVRNASAFEVESVVQGPEEHVESMVEWFKSGPPLAHVDSITVVDLPVDPALPLYTITY